MKEYIDIIWHEILKWSNDTDVEGATGWSKAPADAVFFEFFQLIMKLSNSLMTLGG